MYRKTYVEINIDNIKENAKNIINHYKGYKYYIGVVKGNAYGHGAMVAKYLVEAGINYLAVSSLEEALEVRKYVKESILILEPIDIAHLDICKKENITITLSDYDYYQELIKHDLDGLKVHLKVNSGMNRLGLQDKEQIKEVYDYLLSNNILEGIYTHLGTEGVLDNIWDKQIERWQDLTSLIDLEKVKIVHIGRSTTLVKHHQIPGTNGIRLGIILYGIKPSKINYVGFKGKLRKIKHELRKKKLKISETIYDCPIDIKNTFELCSEIMEIHSIKKGDIVGYGASFIAQYDTKIAVLPVGYADGLNLKYTNMYVKINNKPYKIVGTINCGMITVEVDETVKVNDKVVIIGENVKELASHTNVTPYVIMSSINANVPRIYKEKGKKTIIEKDWF